MSKTDTENDDNTNTEWFVRIDDGDIYGPVDILTLQEWSEQGRIEPQNEISQDRENWITAEELPKLEMNWMAELEDKTTFGPFNFHLTNELVRRGVLSTDTTITNRKTGEIHHVKESDDSVAAIDDTHPAPSPSDDIVPDETEPATKAVTPEISTEHETAETEDKQQDDRENNQVSERLKSMQRSASDARTQLAETRKKLTKQRAINTAMQDNISKLQEDLRNADAEKESISSQLIEQQDRLSEAISEVENTNARLQQLQEHYERLQIENQNQFEELDQLRAEAMEREEEYRKMLNTEMEKSSSKTAILVQALRLISQDKDIKDENIPQKLLPPPDREKTQELQLKVNHLREQLENERQHARQIDELPEASGGSRQHPQGIIVALLLAILLGLVVVLAVILRQGSATETTAKRLPPPVNSTYDRDIPIPDLAETQTDNTADSDSKAAPTASDSSIDSLDLPPEKISSAPQNNTVSVNWPNIVLPRSKITHNNKALRIVFSYGIFSKSTVISPNAKIDLANLAKQLQSSISDFTLIVEGHTDSTPISSSTHLNNYALGTERAVTVKNFLENECGIPQGIIRTASAGESDPPFPNATNESSRRNRTVVLTLIPRQNS